MSFVEKFMHPDDGTFSWARRRRFLYVVNLWCATCTAYILYYRIDGLVAQTVVAMAFGTHASSVAAYVFGAAWQDVSTIRAAGSALPRARTARSAQVTLGSGGAAGPDDDDGEINSRRTTR